MFRRVHFMRHPFWQWTGLLSIGLTGCLHGQDWRAAVTKPTTRPVADRRELRPQPKVVGPFRHGQPKFVPPAEVTTPTAIAARPAATNSVQQFPQEVTLPATAQPEARPRTTHVTPVGLELPPTAATSASPAIVELPRTGPFAEFERTISQRRSIIASSAVPQVEPIEVIVVEESEPEKSTALPVITPAGAIIAAKPVADSISQPRGLFSKTVVLAKELPDVTDTTTAAAKASPGLDSHSANAEPSVRPQDVSVLVAQVFEDLRQRRLNDARQRTEWLKQLVMKRAPASPSNVVREEASVETDNNRSDEPGRLEVDPQATAVKKMAPEPFFDDEKSTSKK